MQRDEQVDTIPPEAALQSRERYHERQGIHEVVVITGASAGLGRATAQTLARQGVSIQAH